MSQPLQAVTFPLWGSRLIEASAGTGKTWTIAALYVRLVLGHGTPDTAFERALSPACILVMTFTRAATRELSERIRVRLSQSAAWFRGDLPAAEADPFLHELRGHYPEGPARQHAAWLLAQAADAMDDAAVHTIDAWCQKVLREHAFDSGTPFDETLLPDEAPLRRQAVHDYWRHSVYPLTSAWAEPVLRQWPQLAGLEHDVKLLLTARAQGGALQGEWPDPDQPLPRLIESVQARHAAAVASLSPSLAGDLGELQHWCDGRFGAKLSFQGTHFNSSARAKAFDQALQWVRQPAADQIAPLQTLWAKLNPTALASVLNAGQALPELPGAVGELGRLLSTLEALPHLGTMLRWHAALWVRQRMALVQRQQGTFTFDDMLSRMLAALEGPHGGRLRQRIVQQHPIALIDEFQDTSPRQYRVFDAAYRVQDNVRSQGLFLIGDPKQSIYGFRGADIHSYLRARDATAGRHHRLDTNRRSTQALVQAVNHVFQQAEQTQPQGAFAFATPARPEGLPFEPVQASGRSEVLHTAQGPMPPLVFAHQTEVLNAAGARHNLAEHAAQAITTWLNDAQAGTLDGDGVFTRLRPADVAVLVRDGKEARAIRRSLRARSVASVYLSDRDSVFGTGEALDLLGWMHAVSHPRDLRLARSAFASHLVGLTLGELLAQSGQDDLWDERLALLDSLHRVWLRQGIVAMVRRTVQTLGLAQRWLAQPQGERCLTNILHLAELLQTASAQLDGEQALLRWFTEQVQAPATEQDDRIVRLESDADLVQVVTIHKSKGLEYPVVVLPFAGSRGPRPKSSVVSVSDADGQRQLHTDADATVKAQVEAERLCEELRLFYVALTRAQHALWLGVTAQTSANVCLPDQKWALNASSLGWLLGATQDTRVADVPALLRTIAHPGTRVQALPSQPGFTPLHAPSEATPLLTPPVYQAHFERTWTVGSYTSLTRDMNRDVRHLTTTPTAPLWAGQEAYFDEVHSPATDPVPAPDLATAATLHAPWHRFPKGPQAGQFLHEQLEWMAQEGFAHMGDEAHHRTLRQRCERLGMKDWQDDTVQWLTRLVATPLPPWGASLAQVGRAVAEMEFWMPSPALSTARVDALCQQHLFPGQPRPALPQRQLQGMLMGFADLFVEHEGRFWVLDHKSNHLGPDDAAYRPEALERAVCEKRYDAQGALYLLALHRLLRLRLGAAYDPQRQLGGAIFLFLRGVAHPQAGCCVLRADPQWLDELDALLQAEDTPGAP